jgi:hypothetical protein
MAKMSANEVIRVHVYNDGDIELQHHVLTPTLKILYPSDLLFGVTEVAKGSLDKELIGYGCDPTRAKEAIDEVLEADYYDTIKV